MAETRSWRFVHPDLDPDVGVTGLTTTAAGRIALTDAGGAVRQALLLLLSTAPGERVMRPEYGCPLHRLVFQPLDDTTAGLAIHYVEQAVRRWEPRVELVAVDAYPSPRHPAQLVVSLQYMVRSSRRQDRLELAVPLEPGGAR